MGLKKWFDQNWVDIGSKKKGGGFKKCGRSKQKIPNVFQQQKLRE